MCRHVFAVLKFVGDECLNFARGNVPYAGPALNRLKLEFVRCLMGTRWFLTRGWVPLTGRDDSTESAEPDRC